MSTLLPSAHREIIGYSIATGYCPAGQFCPDTADLNDDRYLMHRGDASTYTVYGIWDQAAVAPDPWGSGGSGANALPSLTYCLDAVLIRTSEILTVSPFAYYAEAQSWVEGPDAGLWRSQVRDLKFSYQGQQISPWLYNSPEKTGSVRSSARAPTSGYYDPQGGGTFNLETNHRFRGCNATYPYTMTDQVAVPAISSLSPQYLPLGSPTTAISVGGSNLANVEFLPVEPSGGVSATVSSSSASLVQGSVTLQPSAVVGNRSLAVRKPFWYNYAVGGSVYSFRTPQPYTLVSKEYFDSKPATFSIVDATPVIDRIIPTAFQAGSGPVPVTIEGRSFGTQPARILINGAQGGSVSTILATVNSTQPNTILATFTPSPDASGDYTVEVLSGGTTGSGFFAPAGQPSPRSNPRNVNVQPQVRMILTVNGAGVSHGGTVTLPWQDPRLHISASLVGATGTASWRINAYYQAPGESSGHSGVYPIEGPVVLSGTSTWNYTVSTGGTVVVQATPSGAPAVSTQFTVRGVNPPGSEILAYLGPSPWFWENLLFAEQGVRDNWPQFDGSGNPKFGAPHGYGILQVELNPASNDDLGYMFNWRLNLDKGKQRLESFRTSALTWWLEQRQQWLDWNAQHAMTPHSGPFVYEESEPGNPQKCRFANPDEVTGELRSYADALAMKQYNGANPQYLTWIDDGSALGWFVHPANYNTGVTPPKCIFYVYRACTLTMANTLLDPSPAGSCVSYNRQAVSTPLSQ